MQPQTMPNAIVNDAGVWGHRVGFGQRPALLLIDFVQAYTLPASPRDLLAQAEAAHTMPKGEA